MRPRSGCAPRYNADFLCMLETWEAGATFLPATAGKDRQAIDIARLPAMTSPKSGRDGRELHCAFSAPPDVRSPEATDSVRPFSHVDSDLEPYGRPLQHDHTSRSRLTFDGAEHLGVATISEHLCTDIAFARGEVGAAAAVAHGREIVGRGRCVLRSCDARRFSVGRTVDRWRGWLQDTSRHVRFRRQRTNQRLCP